MSRRYTNDVERDADPRIPVLISYAYLREEKDEAIDYILSNPKIEVLLDSGGFTALNVGETIELKDYCDFLHKWGSKLFGAMALDVLGDPVATDANLKEMRRQGLKPVPIHVRGDNQERMDELFEMSDWVGLGGLRRPHRGHSPKSYVKQKMLWANGRNVHWLGYTNQKMVHAFKPYSCDSSNWTAAEQYGFVNFYLGGRWSPNMFYPDLMKLAVPPDYMARVINSMGISWRELRKEENWRGGMSLSKQISAHEFIRYAIDIRAQIGTRVYIATTPMKSHIDSLFRWTDHLKGGAPYALPEGKPR